jgi:SulP family sulfate permease
MSLRALLSRWIPLLTDLRTGDDRGRAQDLLAGTITAILLIPQALAYALLAGLPLQVGLYASVVPVVVYAFLGSSRTLAVGPVAVAAVMVAGALTPYAAGDAQKYLEGALILAALSGALLLTMGLLRMGWLTHFISHPVLAGFTTGAAILIIVTQLPAMTGVNVPGGLGVIGTLHELALHPHAARLPAVAFGVMAVILLLLARAPLIDLLQRLGLARDRAQLISRLAPLVLVLLAIVLSSQLPPSLRPATIGELPLGLPGIDLGFLSAGGWLALLPSAALIALIGYVESISVARALAFRRKERIDADQELIALGASNLAAAGVGAMPVAGGFARSMVNFDAGARTQLSGLVTAAWVALAALLFTGALSPLPKAVLAAIIVVAVWQLIDFKSLRNTWRYDRGDGSAQAATIAGVLLFGIEPGLLIGGGLALLLFLYRTSRPHIAVLGRVAGTEHFRNVNRRAVETWPNLLFVRIDENLYFANVPRVESELQRLVLAHPGTEHVVLVLSGIGYVDASSLEMLDSFESALWEQRIQLHLAEIKGPVRDRLEGTQLLEKLGTQRVHLSCQKALDAILRGRPAVA